MGSTARLVAAATAIMAAAAGCASRKGNGAAGGGSGSGGTGAVAVAAPDAAPAAPTRVEHAVWRFGDNRLMAHRDVGGDLVVDAATSGVARYHRFGMPSPRWQLVSTVDGELASTSASLPALEVPLVASQITAPRIVLRVHVPEPRTLTIKVNGRKASDEKGVELAAGWQTVAVPVGEGRWQVGENLIALELGKKTTLALAWLRVAGGAAAPTDDPRTAATYDPAADAFSIADGAGLAWYVAIPDGAHILADVADAACRFEVVARTSDGSFLNGVLAGKGARVDLTPFAGRVARIELTARECPRATLTGARITLHGEAPVLPAPGAPPRYVVLWVMDALRADKVRAFSPGARAETPATDELAKHGVVFRQFYVQGNESQTSHASIWTGTFPAVHGIRMAGPTQKGFVSRKLDHLGEEMKARGYATAGVTGNGFVNEDNGYARGFDEFRNMMRERNGMNSHIPAAKIVDAALAQLDARLTSPAFLFIGTIDTHNPPIAQRPWIDKYHPQKWVERLELGFIPGRMGCHIVPPPHHIERLRAIYDSEVSYQDSQLGRFIEELKTRGIYDQTMIVITADHGEELFEETRCGHGASLRESLVRVPLLVYYPARFPAGTIVEEGADGVDILPTILDAIDAPALPAAQGATLRPLAHGDGKGWLRPSYASQYELAHTMRLGRWKARVGKTGVPRIEDVVDDPDEKQDLGPTHPIERRMLTDHLGLFLPLRARWQKAGWGVVSNMTAKAAVEIDAAPAAAPAAPDAADPTITDPDDPASPVAPASPLDAAPAAAPPAPGGATP